MSFNLLLGYGGMLSFGHAAFFGVGGYAVAILAKHAGLPLSLSFIAAPFIAGAMAAIIGFFSVRRIGIYFAMLTFAFQMLLYTVALKATGLTGGDDGITGLKATGLLAQPMHYYWFALFIVVPVVILLANRVIRPAVEIERYGDDILEHGVGLTVNQRVPD